MTDERWIRRDGRRELRHSTSHCMGDSEFSFSLHELPSGRCLYEIGGDGNPGVLPGRSGRMFYVQQGGLEIRSTETGELFVPGLKGCGSFAPDPQDVRLLAEVATGGWPPAYRMRVYEVATGRALHEHPGAFGAFSPDGRLLTTLDQDKRVRVFESESGREQWASAPQHARATYAFFSRDGSQVLVADGWDHPAKEDQDVRAMFRFFDAATGGPVATPALPPPPALRGITQICHRWPP
ncbi:MAG TPA: hypothetical protein PK668_09400 [Myxococcota bacterium]|nr:hypothetical protein [Myxococcota bacterium]HRY92803.1 hypothetical protein [Myxococcota bacterium]HSA19821.1 hypothetical protein [Myxococcota bacterium]